MKNLVVFVLFFVTTVCSAQIELEGNKEGIYRVKKDAQEWAPSGITAEPKTIEHINSFSQAINNPGVPILVAKSEKILKLKPIFKKLVEVEEQFIVYKEVSDNIRFFVNVEAREEPSYLLLFSITSILLMIISNILFNKGHTFAAAFSFAAFLFAAFSFASAAKIYPYAAATFAFASAAALFAAVFAIFAFVATEIAADYKRYKVVSIIFYIFMVIHIVLLFV